MRLSLYVNVKPNPYLLKWVKLLSSIQKKVDQIDSSKIPRDSHQNSPIRKNPLAHKTFCSNSQTIEASKMQVQQDSPCQICSKIK